MKSVFILNPSVLRGNEKAWGGRLLGFCLFTGMREVKIFGESEN
jgi:hypothetical protein